MIYIVEKCLKEKYPDDNSEPLIIWNYYYYSIIQLLQNEIQNLNIYVTDFIKLVISKEEEDINIYDFLFKAHIYVEKNEYIFKYGICIKYI